MNKRQVYGVGMWFSFGATVGTMLMGMAHESPTVSEHSSNSLTVVLLVLSMVAMFCFCELIALDNKKKKEREERQPDSLMLTEGTTTTSTYYNFKKNPNAGVAEGLLHMFKEKNHHE